MSPMLVGELGLSGRRRDTGVSSRRSGTGPLHRRTRRGDGASHALEEEPDARLVVRDIDLGLGPLIPHCLCTISLTHITY